jgi:hypothetical protein
VVRSFKNAFGPSVVPDEVVVELDVCEVPVSELCGMTELAAEVVDIPLPFYAR